MIKTCDECGAKCCKHVAIEIDTPETLEEFENLKWYVAHKNVSVYVDEDYQWHVEFLTPCEHLGEEDKCKIYETRPQICRDYDHDECIFHNDSYVEKFTFNSIEDVENYIKDVFEKGEHVTLEVEEEDEEDREKDDPSDESGIEEE